MAKFCALLYREWRVSRKMILQLFIFFAVFSAIIWLLGLSMHYGNLQRLDSSDPYAQMLKQGLTGYTAAYCLGIYSLFIVFSDRGAHAADIRTNWLRYSFALPITPAMRAAVYWGMTVLQLLACLLFNLLNMCMFRLLFGLPFRAEVFSVFAFAAAVGLLLNIALTVFPLGARTQSEIVKRQIISLFSIGLLILAAVIPLRQKAIQAVASLQAQEDLPETEMIKQSMRIIFVDPVQKAYDTCKYFTVPAILLLIAVGYFFTVKAYERREKP